MQQAVAPLTARTQPNTAAFSAEPHTAAFKAQPNTTASTNWPNSAAFSAQSIPAVRRQGRQGNSHRSAQHQADKRVDWHDSHDDDPTGNFLAGMFGPPPRHTVRRIRHSPQQASAVPSPGLMRSTDSSAGNSVVFRPVHASMVASRHAPPAAQLHGAATSSEPSAKTATPLSALPLETLHEDAGRTAGTGRSSGIGRTPGRTAGNNRAAGAGRNIGTGRSASVVGSIQGASHAATQLHASAQISTDERPECEQGAAAIVRAASSPVTEQQQRESRTSLTRPEQCSEPPSRPMPHRSVFVPAVSTRQDLAARSWLPQSARPAVPAAQSSALRHFAAASAGSNCQDSTLASPDQNVSTLSSAQQASAQNAVSMPTAPDPRRGRRRNACF